MNRHTTLADYAARLLLGTGLTAADAEYVAADPSAAVPSDAHHAAAALRDGWHAATPANDPADDR